MRLRPQPGVLRAGLQPGYQEGGPKNAEKIKVLRMGLPIVESLSGLQEIVFSLSRSPQLHFRKKYQTWLNYIELIDFPVFPLFGVPWAAVVGSHLDW